MRCSSDSALPSSIMIYRARFVITMAGDPIRGGEVLVREGRIAAVGTDLASALSDEPVTDLGHAVILPGLVNLHTHLDYSVVRGVLDNEPFPAWVGRLTEIAKAFSYDDFLASARLGALQMVRSGVTTVADSSFSGAAVEAIVEAGLRGTVFQETFGPDPAADYGDQIVRLAERIVELKANACDSVNVGVSPHAVYTSSEPFLRRVADLVRDLDIPVAVHLSETEEESHLIESGTGQFADALRVRGFDVAARGMTSTAYLHDLGLLGPKTIAAHCVCVNQNDVDILAKSRTSVAHCPKSNAKLGAGIAPLADILKRGVATGIGTDSAVSDDSLDMFEEMRFAVLAQRAVKRDVSAMDARRVLELATLGGAMALGLDSEIGTLEPGKRADMVAVDLSSISTFPNDDPYSAVVYSCSAADVILTLIDGSEVYNSGSYSRVDASEVRRAATAVASRI